MMLLELPGSQFLGEHQIQLFESSPLGLGQSEESPNKSRKAELGSSACLTLIVGPLGQTYTEPEESRLSAPVEL